MNAGKHKPPAFKHFKIGCTEPAYLMNECDIFPMISKRLLVTVHFFNDVNVITSSCLQFFNDVKNLKAPAWLGLSNAPPAWLGALGRVARRGRRDIKIKQTRFQLMEFKLLAARIITDIHLCCLSLMRGSPHPAHTILGFQNRRGFTRV